MPPLTFEINIGGNIASALGHANAALGGTAQGAQHAKHELELFESEIGKLGGELGGFGFNLQAIAKGGSLFTFDLAEAAEVAFEALHKVVETVVDLGKEIIKVAGNTQDLNLALKLNVGEEGAKEFEELAESFARTTRFSAAQMKEAWLPLLDIGIKEPKLIDDLTTAATDIAARTHGGIAKVQEVLGTFRQMSLRDQISRGTFTSLGISQEAFFKDLSQQLGVTAEEAEKMAKQHKVASDRLLQTALHQVAAREGGAIGGGTLEGAETLGATFERLNNLKDTVFEKIAEGPGMKALQRGLDTFIKTMQGEAGDRLMAGFDRAFTAIGDFFSPDRVEGFVTTFVGFIDAVRGADFSGFIATARSVFGVLGSIVGVVGSLWGLLRDTGVLSVVGFALDVLGGTIQGVGLIIQELAREVVGLIDSFRSVIAPFQDLDHFLTQGMFDLGTKIWQGLRDGIVAGVSHVKDAVFNLGSDMVSGLKNKLGIHSPSAVFAEMGAHSGEGFAIGMESKAARVSSAARGAIADTAMAGGHAAAAVGGGSTFYFAPSISVHAQTADPYQLAVETAQSVRIEFKKFLDEAGYAFGSPS